jgi:hypothetical protein
MGRIVALVVAVALLIAVALVWLAPATLVATRLDHATAGALTFANAEGTVWKARGSLVAGGIAVPAAWALDPWALARGELRITVAPFGGEPTGGPRGEITIGGDRTALRNVDLTVPAAWIAGATGSRLPWRPAGNVTLTISALEWSPPRSQGEARVVWRDAQVVGASEAASIDLGTLTTTITASGETLAGPIANDGGVVAIRGDVAARAGGDVAITAMLTPRRADDAALARTLAAIGTPEGDGWRVRWRAAWR